MKLSAYLVVSLVALALAIPASAAEGGMYPWVLGERAEAGAAQVVHVERARARSQMESALTKRGEAMNDLMAVERTSAAAGDGFDWGAAGSGAGVAFVLVVAALGIVFLVRRKSVGEAV